MTHIVSKDPHHPHSFILTFVKVASFLICLFSFHLIIPQGRFALALTIRFLGFLVQKKKETRATNQANPLPSHGYRINEMSNFIQVNEVWKIDRGLKSVRVSCRARLSNVG